jgi:glycosyltransferase involved in cell wall biosynthesis
MNTAIKVVEITNNPVPYRVPIYNRIARDPRVEMTHIFSILHEPGRTTDLPPLEFKSILLKPNYRSNNGHNIHNNPDVFGVLRRLDPDVVITDGFNPTSLYGFIYAKAFGKKHIPMTDGTYDSEQALSWKHKLVRRLVYKRSHAFIGASEGSRRLYASYGIDVDRLFFQSHLCIDNQRFALPEGERPYDFIFCSRLIEGKRPLFALEVAERAAAKLGRTVKALFVGEGVLEAPLRQRAATAKGVDCRIHGFARQAELPELYNQAKVFLFPTAGDVWGVVVNEACASGLPVISSPYAGVVGDLLQDNDNGLILDFDVDRWTDALVGLLRDEPRRQRYAQRSRERVQAYTYAAAADGLVRAALHAAGQSHGPTDRSR